MDSKNFDILLISFFLSLAIYSGIKVFVDDEYLNLLGTGQNIATISGQENTVKRKKKGMLPWLDTSVGDRLGGKRSDFHLQGFSS